ncbi:MAG: hypothetical protein QM703_24935 [Gemmatales bacterium]
MQFDKVVIYSLPVIETFENSSHVSSTIKADGKSFDIWYRVSSGPVADGVESFLLACLVPAMKLGCPVRTPAPVSAKLYHGLLRFQQVLHGWFPELKPVPIETELRTRPLRESLGSGTGSFFSAGVDACYTFLKNQAELTACILVHGFDYHLEHSHIRQAVSQMAHQAMQTLGRPLIEVDTNLRSFSDHYADFRQHYFGSILASVAQLISPQIRKVYISSSRSADKLKPWGSHPDLDYLCGSDELDVVHYGCDVTRSQKTMYISQSDAILKILRVCISGSHHSAEQYNCGKCEKCLRTMMDLRLAGALDRCTTFRHPFSLHRLARTRIDNDVMDFYEESYVQAKERRDDPALIRTLEACISNKHHTGFAGVLQRMRKQMKRHIVRPVLGPVEQVVQRMVGR